MNGEGFHRKDLSPFHPRDPGLLGPTFRHPSAALASPA
jgi:hypothetical protein